MSKTYFVSFSGSVGEQDTSLCERQSMLSDSARKYANIDEAIQWTRNDLLDHDFYLQNKSILDQPRGAGYWAWKPFVILQTLNKINKDDWLIYSDVGKPFRRGDDSRAGNSSIGNILYTPVDPIINFSAKHDGFMPGIWIPHYGKNMVWSKRDCFVGMGCDSSEYYDSGQVQATYSCWSNNEASRDFLMQWLRWCQVEAVITDNTNIYGKPNAAVFRDHRHDQSILTNLVIKNQITLFGPKDKTLGGHRDLNHIIRHIALGNELTQAREQFKILFSDRPLLTKSLHPALELWLLPELKPGSLIAVESVSEKERWHSAFPQCHLNFGSSNIDKSTKSKYSAIFAGNISNHKKPGERLSMLYEALVPGGLLLLEAKIDKNIASVNSNDDFAELINWMFTNQRFPKHLSTPHNQKPNAITIGNALNPFISPLVGDQYQVIFRKPYYDVTSPPT